MTNAIQEKGKKNYQNSFSQQFLSFITSNQTISEDSIQIYLIHDFQIHYIHGLTLTKNVNLYPNFTIIFRVPQFISFHITHLETGFFSNGEKPLSETVIWAIHKIIFVELNFY